MNLPDREVIEKQDSEGKVVSKSRRLEGRSRGEAYWAVSLLGYFVIWSFRGMLARRGGRNQG